MKKIYLSLLSAALCLNLVAQKTINDANAEKRNVSGYHAVSVSGGIDLYLSPGNESVAVSASETRFRDRIKTEVKDGVLKIWYDYKSSEGDDRGNKKMKAYVSYKTLDMLSGSGGSDIDVDGSIQSNSLKLDLSGGSDFEGKVQVTSLDVEASGGSDLDISGTAKTLTINASGGSDVKGYGLVTDVCNLEASGGSDVEITVNKEITANASGSSDVSFKGSGVIKSMKSSGSSSVKKAGR
ncbi:MAG: DUF2807 domain-containing protein [Chitinophagaceae bacterium]|nr:DUF2807 domain-containing protein [Chitinophagaceae bacterium]